MSPIYIISQNQKKKNTSPPLLLLVNNENQDRFSSSYHLISSISITFENDEVVQSHSYYSHCDGSHHISTHHATQIKQP